MDKGDEGWRVYDSQAGEVIDSETHEINQIKVTNHSNAGVWALLDYKEADDYTDVGGSFTTDADDEITVFDTTKKSLTLATAVNPEDGTQAGTPSVGTVYFMPTAEAGYKKGGSIAKWSQLETISVAIAIEKP